MSETKTQEQEVKRYDMDADCENCGGIDVCPVEYDHGDWVKHSDYATLTRERDSLRKALTAVAADIEHRCSVICEDFKPYKRHAPECMYDLAVEARQILSATEGRKG